MIKEKTNLLRRWSAQLYKEHEDICWCYNISLSVPVIEVVNTKTFWGIWCPEFGSGRIKISSKLIEDHSWDVVINVLKHEMAHQIVTELFNSGDGHGEHFKTACRMLGLSNEFSISRGDLPRTIEDAKQDALDPEAGRIAGKVKKLLSLAQSKNEHESSLAMQKAKEFINKYNLERTDINNTSKYRYKIINHRKKRIENYQRNICSILQNYFFVRVVYSYLYDARADETYRTIEIMGTMENVVMAEYVYFFLLNQLSFLWNDHRSKTGSPNRKKRSYWLGVLSGFREKLEIIEKKSAYRSNNPNKTIGAVICTKDKMLSDFKKMRFPKLKKSNSRAASIYEGTYNAGIDDGRKLNLHRGISSKDGFKGELLQDK